MADIETHQQQKPRNDLYKIDIPPILNVLFRQKRVIAGAIFTLIALSVLVTSQLTPYFTARALLLVDRGETGKENTDEVTSGLPANSATIDSDVEVIKSDRVAIEVIQKLNLLASENFSASKSPLDWARQLTGLTQREREEEPSSTAALVRALELFRDRLWVRRRGVTYVIEIRFTAQDPQMAAKVVNAVTQGYLRQQTESRIEVNQRTASLLRERLTALSRQIRESEDSVDNFVQSQVDTALLGKSSQDLEQAMLLWQNARQESEKTVARFKDLQKRVASGDYLSAAAVLNSRNINRLVAVRKKLADREAKLQSQASEQGRDLFDLQNDLRTITSRIREDVGTAIKSLRLRVAQIEDSRKAARETLRQLSAKNRQLSGVAFELWKLQQNTETARDLYEKILSRLRQTEQGQSVPVVDSRVISAALPPIEPSYPPTSLIYILTTLFSTVIGVGVGLARDYFARGVHGESQLEQVLGIPVVAGIPQVAHSGRASAVNGSDSGAIDMVVDHPMSVFAESIRRARRGVELAAQTGHPTGRKQKLCVMIAAALSGEGKSTLAVLLARSWAQAGKKVVLVDFDFRHPSIHRLLGGGPAHDNEPIGVFFRELFEDPNSTVKYLHASSQLGETDPDYEITEDTARRIIEDLKQRFDIVVVDAPPLLAVIDAQLVLPSVDVTLFVVRAYSTSFSNIVRALRDVRHAGNPVIAVLNGVKAGQSSYYGHDVYRGAYEQAYSRDEA